MLFDSNSTLNPRGDLSPSVYCTFPYTIYKFKFRVKQIQKNFQRLVPKIFWLGSTFSYCTNEMSFSIYPNPHSFLVSAKFPMTVVFSQIIVSLRKNDTDMDFDNRGPQHTFYCLLFIHGKNLLSNTRILRPLLSLYLRAWITNYDTQQF